MKRDWNDDSISKVLRSLKNEPPPDPLWADRTWARIESRLGEKKGFAATWFGAAPLRWAAVAAVLLIGVGLNQQHRRGVEVDLGDYVSTLSGPAVELDDAEVEEPFLVSDRTGLMNAGYSEEDESETTVYDTILEL